MKKKQKEKTIWSLFYLWLTAVFLLISVFFILKLVNKVRVFLKATKQNSLVLLSYNNNGVVVFSLLAADSRGYVYYFPAKTKWRYYSGTGFLTIKELIKNDPSVVKTLKMNLAVPISAVYYDSKDDFCPLGSRNCLENVYLPHVDIFSKKGSMNWWQSLLWQLRFRHRDLVIKEISFKKDYFDSQRWDRTWQKYSSLPESYRVTFFDRLADKSIRNYYHRLAANLGWQVNRDQSIDDLLPIKDYNEEDVNYCFGPDLKMIDKKIAVGVIFNCLERDDIQVKNLRSDIGVIIQSFKF